MSAKKKKKPPPGLLGDNRRARFLYSVEERLECGIQLAGSEVKSMKSAMFSFTDAYVEVRDTELWLRSFHITPYSHAGVFNHDAQRPVNEKGLTLIPLKFYLSHGCVKVEVGLCRGKKMHDKRESIKRRDIERDLNREYRAR